MQVTIAFVIWRANMFVLCSFVALRVAGYMRDIGPSPVRLSWLATRQLQVWIWCEGCSHHKSLPVAPLLEKFGDVALLALKAHFQCAACGGREVFLRPDWHSAGWTQGVVSRHEKLPD